MFKALIAGVAEMAHVRAEPAGGEQLSRACAYLEAAGACALIAVVAVLLL